MQPVADRPRFRQDLVAESIDDAGARFIDVMDPDSGNVFRFFEVEYSLACAMDGERDVPGIVQWAKEELGLTPSAREVRTVIATLGDLGYLEPGAAAAARPAAPATKNQWDDGPTAITANSPDEDLMPGVVVGGRRVATPVADMELGQAGSRSSDTEADLPQAADVELGSPGSTSTSRPPRSPDKTQVDDIPLGVSGRADVSVDLSDAVGVGVDDVKEAVRASQVMKAVDVPKELLDSLESEPDRPVAKPAPRPVEAAPPPKPVAVEPPKPIAKPAPAPESPKPVAKPAPAHEPANPIAKPAAEPPKAPPAPAPTANPVLVGMLVLVVLGAIAFIVYKFVLKKHDDDQTSATPAKQEQQPVAVAPVAPPPPAVEIATLTTGAETTATIKPATTGQIETLATAAVVNSGDVIVRFVGHKPIETEIQGLERDIEKRVKPELAQAEKDRDAAQTANNKAAVTAAEGRITDRQKSLDDKQGKLAAKKSELEKLVVRTPATGKLTVKAKVGARVSPNDDVATIVSAPVRSAKFTKAPPVAPKARVLLVTKSDHKNVPCVVTSSDPGAVTVACPQDAAPDGAEVTFGGLDPSPPPAPAPTSEIDDGSAAPAPPTTHPAAPRPAPAPTPAKGSADVAPPTAPPAAGTTTTTP